jgi:HlyD family type I secretion membrane fusion protein
VRDYESQALKARLLAERDGLDRIVFPEDLLAEKARSVVANAIMGQEGVFAARKHTLDNQTGILNQKILQYREEIAGLKVQIAAEANQLALLRQEADAVSELVDKELAAKPRLLALKRAIADLTGSQGNNSAQIARAEQSVLEADLRIVDLKNRQMDEVVLQLRDVEATIGDLAERLRSAKHDLEATELPAPKTGIVVATNVHTIGGVVGPGEVLMEIVPENDALMVEARIRPQDIDHVHVGLAASVRLVGFNTRIVPTVDGSVTYVSADSLLDRPSNSRYYIARVQVDLKAKPDTADLKLQPGMPTHVMVITGTRTLFEYLLAPIADSVSRAMHEI